MTIESGIELSSGKAININDGTADYQTPVWDATAGKYVVSTTLKVDDDLETVTITGNAGNPQQIWAYTPGSVQSSWKTDAAGITTLTTSGNSFVFPSGSVTAPGVALGDGDTGLYEESDDSLNIAIAGVLNYRLRPYSIDPNILGGFSIRREVASATNPVYVFSDDEDSGIGSSGDDQLSLISGGVEGQRIVEDAAWGISTHFPSVSAAPTAIAGKFCIYELSGSLYWQDSSGTSHQISVV